MKHWPALALVLAGACTDLEQEPAAGGGGKADGHEAFSRVTTSWELQVGGGGDAVVAKVKTLADGTLVATSHFPHWVMRATAAGQRVTTFGTGYRDLFGDRFIGAVEARAGDVWQVGATELVGAIRQDTGVFTELVGWTATGNANTAFGAGGSVRLPSSSDAGAATVAIEHDAARDRFAVLVVREWLTKQITLSGPPQTIGPKKLEVLAIDATTGVTSSLGTFTLPDWEYLYYTNAARVFDLVVQPDDSFVVLADNMIDVPVPERNTSEYRHRWSAFHLVPGQPPVQTSLAVTSGYLAGQVAFTRVGGGRFDLYLDGIVDGVSTSDTDKQLVRVSLDDSFEPELDVLGAAVDRLGGCTAAAASGDLFVVGEGRDRTKPLQFTAYPKGGEPFTFTGDLTKRCLLSLSLGPSGQLHAGTWDTTESGWKAMLTTMTPE